MPLPTEFLVVNLTVGEVLVCVAYSGGYPVLTSIPISEVKAQIAAKKQP